MSFKLESYLIISESNSEQYINNFLTSFQELNKITGEAILESHALSLFLRGVKDTDFEMTAEIQKNKDDDNLPQSINCYSGTREGVHEERVYRKKIRNKTSHFCKEGDCYIDEDFTFKRAHRQRDKD